MRRRREGPHPPSAYIPRGGISYGQVVLTPVHGEGRPRVVTSVRPRGPAGRLALLVLALGLVLMHHFVAAHQHTPSSAQSSTTPGTLTAASADAASAARSVVPPAPLLHLHEPGGHPGPVDVLTHDCPALLDAAALLLALVLLAVVALAVRPGGTASGTSPPTGPRAPAPPTSQRLARLQVLRV